MTICRQPPENGTEKMKINSHAESQITVTEAFPIR